MSSAQRSPTSCPPRSPAPPSPPSAAAAQRVSAASGSGNINETVDLPAGATVTYTVIADIASGATGDLVNTATIARPAGVTDPNAGQQQRDRHRHADSQVALAVVKTDGSARYTPGGTATYTVTVTNTGPSDAADVTVSDPSARRRDADRSATCVANGVATCGTVTGSIGETSFGTTGAQVGAGTGNSLVFTCRSHSRRA